MAGVRDVSKPSNLLPIALIGAWALMCVGALVWVAVDAFTH